MGAEGEVDLWMDGCFEVLPWPASKSLPASANWRPPRTGRHPEASADIRRSARLQQAKLNLCSRLWT